MIKKLTGFLVVILLTLIVIGAGSQNGNAGNGLIASGHPEYPPFMWRQGEEIVGVGPALVSLVLEQIGLSASFDYVGTWDEVIYKAVEGEIDIVVAMYDTEERRQTLLYSNSFSKDPVVAFVLEGAKIEYSKWSDLIGKKGVSTVGESFGTVFDDYLKTNLDVIRYSNVEQCFKELEDGNADYFLYALYSGEMNAEKMGYKIDYLEPYITVEKWYVGISKNSQLINSIDEINAIIDKLVNEEIIEELILEYIYKYNLHVQD